MEKDCTCNVFTQAEVWQMANAAVFNQRREDADFFSRWHARLQALSVAFDDDFYLAVEVDEKGNRAGLLVDGNYLKFLLV